MKEILEEILEFFRQLSGMAIAIIVAGILILGIVLYGMKAIPEGFEKAIEETKSH